VARSGSIGEAPTVWVCERRWAGRRFVSRIGVQSACYNIGDESKEDDTVIFAYADLLRVSFTLFIVFFGSVVGALLIGITIHEFSHCLTAFLLGDRTAKNLGRLTLNPKAHLDPIGTVLLFMVGFGWGKPAPVNPYRLSAGPKTGMALVAVAGPLSNLAIAGLAGFPIHAGMVPWHTPFVVYNSASLWSGSDYLGLFLSATVIFNIVLALFNLIPLAPLDGFRIAVGILPDDLSQALASLEQYSMAIILLIFLLPMMTGGHFGIIQTLSPAINGLTSAFTGTQVAVFG
jgi:Zn-dependent protease